MALDVSLVKAAAATALVMSAGVSNAALNVYTTAASFGTAVTASGTDTYDTLQPGFIASPLTRTAGAYGYTAGASGGLYGIAGSLSDRWLSTDESGEVITLNGFTGGARAIGGFFFATDFTSALAAGQSITLTATDSLGATAAQTISSATETSFVGFVSTGNLASLTVSVGNNSYYGTINNLVLAVPEPGTYAMLLTGLGVVGAATTRRRGRR